MLPKRTKTITSRRVAHPKSYLRDICVWHVKRTQTKLDVLNDLGGFDKCFDYFFETVGMKLASNDCFTVPKSKIKLREVFGGIFTTWASIYLDFANDKMIASSYNRLTISNEEALSGVGRTDALLVMKYIIACLSRLEVNENGDVGWSYRTRSDFSLEEACVLSESCHTAFIMPHGSAAGGMFMDVNNLSLVGKNSLLDFHCDLEGDVDIGAKVMANAMTKVFGNICYYPTPITNPTNLYSVRKSRAKSLLETVKLTPVERSILTETFDITDFEMTIEKLDDVTIMTKQQLLENQVYWEEYLQRYLASNDLLRSLTSREKKVLCKRYTTCIAHPRFRKYK